MNHTIMFGLHNQISKTLLSLKEDKINKDHFWLYFILTLFLQLTDLIASLVQFYSL